MGGKSIRLADRDTLTWDEAEQAFPGCSPAWDVQDMPSRLLRYPNSVIELLVLGTSLYCDVVDPNNSDHYGTPNLLAYVAWSPRGRHVTAGSHTVNDKFDNNPCWLTRDDCLDNP